MPSDTPGQGIASQSLYLLPGFDEYLLGYKNRDAVLDVRRAPKIVPGNNGMFLPTLVIDGRVTGTWKRVLKKKSIIVTVSPFTALKKTEKEALAQAVERYGNFIGMPADMALL